MSNRDGEDEAHRWLRYAEEDLTAAEAIRAHPGGVPRQACWLAQQAAEKSIKAVLILLGTGFPRSHDLEFLRGLVPTGRRVRDESVDLAALSEWAVEARYPGDWPEAEAADAEQAIRLARQVVDAAKEDVQRWVGH